MPKSQGTPRVRELLDEMTEVLYNMKAEASEGNSKLGGVLDSLLVMLEEAREELDKGKATDTSLMSFVRLAADLVEIIGKIQDTLFYTVCCLAAAIHRKRAANDCWEKYKAIQNYGWA